jgi:hypothetical protein
MAQFSATPKPPELDLHSEIYELGFQPGEQFVSSSETPSSCTDAPYPRSLAMFVSPKHRSARRSGAAAVEFALLLPFIMLIFSIGVDWCRIYYCAHTIEECARTGALAGSGIAYQERGLAGWQREARVRSEAMQSAVNLDPPLESGDIVIEIESDYVTVTVNYDFHTIIPFLAARGAWPLSRSVRMPIMP